MAATCAWLLACALVLFPVWPFLSPMQLRWVLLIVVGPPLYAWGRHVGSALFPFRVGQRIPGRFSVLRTLFGLVVMLLFYALVVLAARYMGIAV